MTAAAPGPRPSVTAARRAPTLRWRSRPASRTSGPKRRAAATAAANAIRPGQEEQDEPAPWLSASRDSSAAPPSSAASTRATEPRPPRCRAGRSGSRHGRASRWRPRRPASRERRRRRRARAPPARERSRGARRRRALLRGRRRAPRRPMPTSQPVDGARDRDDRALGQGQQPQLPAAGAVPGEPAPGRLEIAPHAPRGEHGEGEEQRGRLAADEQQPPPGDRRGSLGRPQLLDGRLHAVADRVGGEGGARLLAPRRRGRRSPRAAAGRPRAARPRRSSGTCWPSPVPASAPRSPRRRRAAPAAAGDSALPAAAPAPPRDPRARCRSARGSRRTAGSSGASPCRPARAAARARPGARRCLAAAGPRSGPGVHRRGRRPLVRWTYGARPVDAGERDEVAGDGALAEEDDRGRARQARCLASFERTVASSAG